MDKALIYARVSTKEQAEEGYSLASQIKLLRDYAEKNSLDVVKEFVIPESASGRQERKTFKLMMDYCKKRGIGHILCEKVDRITRNLQDAVWIDAWLQENQERRIHFVKQNLVIHQNAKSYEKFQWDIYVVLARQYSNNLSEETKKGLLEKAEEGWYPGPNKRGYVTVGDRGHKVWEVDRSATSEAPFIFKAFTLYAKGGYTISTIREMLFKEGWMSPGGKKLPRALIHTILSDPFYCGKFIWNGKEYEGKHEPLICEETFALTQKKLKRPLKNGKVRKHEFLYAGLLQCASCNSSVSAEVQKGYIYYRCTRYKPCNERKCVREETITAQIIQTLEALRILQTDVMDWLSRALKECHEGEKNYHERVMKDLTEKLSKIKARIDLLYDDRADKRIDTEFFEERLNQYRRQQQEVVRKIARHKEAAINYAKTANDILTVSQSARELFEKLDLKDKRDLFKFILSDVRLQNGKLFFAYNEPFNRVHEIATFQPQESIENTGLLRGFQESRSAMLPGLDDFPTIFLPEGRAKLLQEWFGILEFPATTAELAARFAAIQLCEDLTLAVAA